MFQRCIFNTLYIPMKCFVCENTRFKNTNSPRLEHSPRLEQY